MKYLLHTHDLKLILVLFGIAVFLCGCSSSYQVRSTAGQGDYTYEEMNKELKGRHADIEIEGEKKVSAKEINIAGDSVSWLDTRTDETSAVSIVWLRKIVTKNHFIGGLEGLGFGMVGGGGLGALAGSSSRDAYLGAAWGLIIGGGAGTVLGLTTGLISGHSYNYEFPQTEHSDSGRRTFNKFPTTEQSDPGEKIIIEKPPVKTDVIYLKKGGTVRGTIITESRDGDRLISITIRNLEGENRTYTSSEIERIERGIK